jgi:hypothetical protein
MLPELHLINQLLYMHNDHMVIKEWFRGWDLNEFRDIWTLLFQGMEPPRNAMSYTRCDYNRGDYKVSQTKRGTQWDRVDFHKECLWVGILDTLGPVLYEGNGNTQ